MFSRFAVGTAIVVFTFVVTLLSLDYYFGDLNKPWVSYTPSIRALTGSIEAATGTGTYKIIGTTVHFQMAITISRNGTGASGLQVTLPVASKSATVIVGRDASAGPMLQGVITPSAGTVTFFTFSNGYPGGDGKTLFAAGVYERKY